MAANPNDVVLEPAAQKFAEATAKPSRALLRVAEATGALGRKFVRIAEARGKRRRTFAEAAEATGEPRHEPLRAGAAARPGAGRAEVWAECATRKACR